MIAFSWRICPTWRSAVIEALLLPCLWYENSEVVSRRHRQHQWAIPTFWRPGWSRRMSHANWSHYSDGAASLFSGWKATLEIDEGLSSHWICLHLYFSRSIILRSFKHSINPHFSYCCPLWSAIFDVVIDFLVLDRPLLRSFACCRPIWSSWPFHDWR